MGCRSLLTIAMCSYYALIITETAPLKGWGTSEVGLKTSSLTGNVSHKGIILHVHVYTCKITYFAALFVFSKSAT